MPLEWKLLILPWSWHHGIWRKDRAGMDQPSPGFSQLFSHLPSGVSNSQRSKAHVAGISRSSMVVFVVYASGFLLHIY